VSFPAKFPGVCRKCGERIAVGAMIEWRKDEGAWHEECYGPGPVDFTGIERYLQAKHAEAIAAGWVPPDHGPDAEIMSRQVNEAAGIHWSPDRGFYGRAFPV